MIATRRELLGRVGAPVAAVLFVAGSIALPVFLAQVGFMRVPFKMEESFKYASVNGADSLPAVPPSPSRGPNPTREMLYGAPLDILGNLLEPSITQHVLGDGLGPDLHLPEGGVSPSAEQRTEVVEHPDSNKVVADVSQRTRQVAGNTKQRRSLKAEKNPKKAPRRRGFFRTTRDRSFAIAAVVLVVDDPDQVATGAHRLAGGDVVDVPTSSVSHSTVARNSGSRSIWRRMV